MPAINPSRLRFQITGLIYFFQSPPEFHHRLRDFFSQYANLTLRFGDSIQSRSLSPMYHLPPPIIRQLELDLKPHINGDPTAALAIADELWKDEYFEVQQIALFILGITPLDDPEPILERLHQWLTPELDHALTIYLFSTGTLRLQTAFPDIWESFIKSYLTQDDPEMIAIGLNGLAEGLTNPTFKNLPAIFRLVSPFIREPQREHIRELAHLIEALAKRSSTETAFFLRQALSVSESPETRRLIKQCLPLFPESIQQDLKSSLKN